MMLKEIIDKLNEMSCRELQEMADNIDVHFNTLILIRLGKNKNPKLSTVLAIQSYFK
ncbi:MAG: hypothetical protein J5965_20670 [Aeriscardovia sp.]|nr:hypothetical protein [Aeriscardovia sp.]